MDTKKKILESRRILGIPHSKTYDARLSAMTPSSLEAEAKRLDNRVTSLRLAWTKDGRKALARILELRERMNHPVQKTELVELLKMDKPDVLVRLKSTEERWRNWQDDHGVPVAYWRVLRGFASPEVMEADGVARNPREARMSIAELRESVAKSSK